MSKLFEGHTPGPWEVNHIGSALYVEGGLPDKAGLCCKVQAWDSNGMVSLTDKANAALIAAAPDLLRQRDALLCELRGLVEQMDLIGIPQWHGAEGLSLDAARKVIALCEKEN